MARFSVMESVCIGYFGIKDTSKSLNEHHWYPLSASKEQVNDVCELMNAMASELHALMIAPEIERLEELRDLGRFHQTTFDDKCGFKDHPDFYRLVDIGIYKDLGVDDDGFNQFERISDTDQVIDAEIQKLKEGI